MEVVKRLENKVTIFKKRSGRYCIRNRPAGIWIRGADKVKLLQEHGLIKKLTSKPKPAAVAAATEPTPAPEAAEVKEKAKEKNKSKPPAAAKKPEKEE